MGEYDTETRVRLTEGGVNVADGTQEPKRSVRCDRGDRDDPVRDFRHAVG